MKPTVVGSSCQRVQAAVEDALMEGTLNLPAELAAHAARCARCSAEVADTEHLLGRLRGAVAAIDLGQVPRVVDYVMTQTAALIQPARPAPLMPAPKKKVPVSWVLGQVAAVAAALLIAVGGLTYMVLKVNQAVSGVAPGDVLARLTAPFTETNRADVRPAK